MKLGPILPDSHDVNVLFTSFYSKMSNILDKYATLKRKSCRRKKSNLRPSELWITPVIKVSMDIKNNLHKNYLKARSLYLHSRFEFYRSKLNNLLRISKRMYYNDFFFSIKTSLI